MKRSGSLLTFVALLAAALIMSACGSGRRLQAVTLSPAAADAKNFSNGQVSFTATGAYNKPPSPVTLTSSDVVWCVGDSTGACAGNINPGAILDQKGTAQCNPFFTGTVTILAGTSPKASPNPDGGSQLKIFGSAQLTCP